ncbi:MAG TPA: hypothetical protein VM029_03255 [Opitutaceae bacterium]|nr:hypothetical protein [Opitutaceae bacterium]
MTVDLPIYLLAAVLLLFPRSWMRAGQVFFPRRRKTPRGTNPNEPWRARVPGDPRLDFRREFTRFRNYIDLLRAAAGSLLIIGGMGLESCVAVQADASPLAVKGALALRFGTILVGLLLQTVRLERGHVTFYPPVFYFAGLSIGLCHLTGAAFAFVMIWAVNPALSSAHAFLTMYALLVVAFGQLFAGRRDLMTIFAGLLCFLPVLLSLLTRRPLRVLSRKPTRAGAG